MSLPEHHFATDSQNPSKEQLENLVTNSSISIKYHPHYYKYLQPVISSTSSSATPDSGRPACLVPIIATHPTEGRTVAEEGDSIHVEERERMRVRSIDGARHKPLTRPVQVRKRRPRYPTPVDKKASSVCACPRWPPIGGEAIHDLYHLSSRSPTSQQPRQTKVLQSGVRSRVGWFLSAKSDRSVYFYKLFSHVI